MNTIKFIFELINRGGPINWVITLFYFISFAVILEKSIYFIKTKYSFNEITSLLTDNNLIKILNNNLITKYKYSQVVIILKEYIQNKNKKQKIFNEIIEEKGFGVVQEMEKHIWILSEIGHIAPLLGLLGTITGLIKAFHRISQMGGDVDVMALSSGIWEAMLTTANGLIVAIPSFLAFKLFQKIIEKRSDDMSLLISRLNVMCDTGEKVDFSGGISKNGETIDDEV